LFSGILVVKDCEGETIHKESDCALLASKVFLLAGETGMGEAVDLVAVVSAVGLVDFATRIFSSTDVVGVSKFERLSSLK
jgi:hypothetical protein